MPGSNTSQPFARPEQSKQSLINIASLPREEAIECARDAGREILADSAAVQAVADTLWMNWVNVNVPVAVGQTDDEFGELVDVMGNKFFEGLTEGVKRFAEDTRTLARVDEFLCDESRFAWKIHNVLAFMRAALDEDPADGLPVKCTVTDLDIDVEKLATNLMDLVHKARHA
ncbi:hypothetical protein [Paraburkholderia fynbosensis]|uniref:Uncharacterized protein n=1 Tax=Paraburkholderia fynbosensis TaxID=1200993 RepID=A0A6J5FQ03_9BURK|nr:hypothetical protein [Paraburkholderia fynbosensis]CAB3782160.1 hypothetical protein LMG27177_01180 [Paraburkholderia fynbosensis]